MPHTVYPERGLGKWVPLRFGSVFPINFYDFSVTKNNGNENCRPEKDFGTHNPVKKEVRLFSNNPIEANYSGGIGEFTVIIGLAPESKYCVLVEHVHHPYCTVHSGKNLEKMFSNWQNF